MNGILIHYHEIALKKGNRALFVEQLVRNIRSALKEEKGIKITKLYGRLLLDIRFPTASVGNRISHIPGIANFLSVFVVKDLEGLKKKLEEKIKSFDFVQDKSFRITTQR